MEYFLRIFVVVTRVVFKYLFVAYDEIISQNLVFIISFPRLYPGFSRTIENYYSTIYQNFHL